jgi:pimeloyl-ACP methyl ester carboxylesterase
VAVNGRFDYDEFGLFHENAAEYGLPYDRPPTVRRVFADVAAAIRALAPAAKAVIGTMAFNPSRSRSALRRGILHNAEQQPDGTWVWRWARHRGSAAPAAQSAEAAPAGHGTRYARLWAPLSAITVPVLLVRGLRPDSVLDDDDERELRRRLPSAQVIHVTEAGHSVQGDAPLELAAIVEGFVFRNEEHG